MLDSGRIWPLVSETFTLDEAVDALRLVQAGRAVWKLVVQIAPG